jgi:predicted DNA-binding transcriptional regulator AlpA
MDDIQPLLLRHPQAQKMLGISASTYWALVRRGELEVVGRGRMSRASYRSVQQYVAKLLAEAGKAA